MKHEARAEPRRKYLRQSDPHRSFNSSKYATHRRNSTGLASHPSQLPAPCREVSNGDSVIGNGRGSPDNLRVHRDGNTRRPTATSPLLPPVTRQSLAELDFSNIVRNLRLRHDINLERELVFQPNSDGPGVAQRAQEHQNYWTALQSDFDDHSKILGEHEPATSRSDDSTARCRATWCRIRHMLETIRDIVLCLIPKGDRKCVDEQLDIPNLMQQISHGLCNFVSLSRWMGQLLRSHCAPMRDCRIEEMVDSFVRSDDQRSNKYIVHGIRELFDILEAMKLDVANYQVRHYQRALIEDSVKFEQDYHRQLIKCHRLDIQGSKTWYSERARYVSFFTWACETGTNHTQLETFQCALLSHIILDSEEHPLPVTFHLDNDRLRGISGEMSDFIHLSVCYSTVTRLRNRLRCKIDDIAVDYYKCQQVLRNIVDKSCGESTVAVLPSPSAPRSRQNWSSNVEDLASEIVFHALQPTYLYKRYGIFTNDVLYADAINSLKDGFGDQYQQHARYVYTVFSDFVCDITRQFGDKTELELFDALTVPSTAAKPSRQTLNMPPLSALPLCTTPVKPLPPHGEGVTSENDAYAEEDTIRQTWRAHLSTIAKRVAHIGILHWRVWGPLVYETDDQDTV